MMNDIGDETAAIVIIVSSGVVMGMEMEEGGEGGEGFLFATYYP